MKFELYECKVNLSGKKSMIVGKIAVTAPQIAVLRRIHGVGSVTDIKRMSPSRFTLRQKLRAEHTDAQEFDFLLREYEPHIVDGQPPGTNVVAMIWPGLQAILPRNIDQLPREAETETEGVVSGVDSALRADPALDLDAPEGDGSSEVVQAVAPKTRNRARVSSDDLDGAPVGI